MVLVRKAMTMAKKNAKNGVTKNEVVQNQVKGKCYICGTTENLKPVLYYTSTGKRKIIRKCPKHYDRA